MIIAIVRVFFCPFFEPIFDNLRTKSDAAPGQPDKGDFASFNKAVDSTGAHTQVGGGLLDRENDQPPINAPALE